MEVGGLVAVQGEQVAKGVTVGQEHEHVLGKGGWMKEALPVPLHAPGGTGAPLPTKFNVHKIRRLSVGHPIPQNLAQARHWGSNQGRLNRNEKINVPKKGWGSDPGVVGTGELSSCRHIFKK